MTTTSASALRTGGCACGAIRYAFGGEPLFQLNCHCRESGAAYAAVIGVARSAFAVTRGTPRTYEVTADSGSATRRAFCGDCGSPLFGLPGSAPDLVTVRAGSLDDPSGFRPARDIYVSRAQPWDCMDPQLPKAAKLG